MVASKITGCYNKNMTTTTTLQMHKTWITSDLHFGHSNILKFNPDTRKFRDAEHMNAEMIRQWNEAVQPGDTVYILGDVAFCRTADAVSILKQLAGRKILVKGNHDSKHVKDAAFRACFAEVHKYLVFNYNGHRIVSFHFPLLEWDQCHRGAIHFYGHVHGHVTGLEKYRARDVGMDATGRVVTLIDDMIQDALRGEIKTHGDSTADQVA